MANKTEEIEKLLALADVSESTAAALRAAWDRINTVDLAVEVLTGDDKKFGDVGVFKVLGGTYRMKMGLKKFQLRPLARMLVQVADELGVESEPETEPEAKPVTKRKS